MNLKTSTTKSPSSGAEQPLFRFGIVADVQYADKPTAGKRAYAESLGKLEACANDMNRRQLAFVVNLGDIIDGRGAETAVDLERAARSFRKFRAPVRHVIGNHCLIARRQMLMKALRLKAPYYEFIQAGWRFIVLDGMDVSSPEPEDAISAAEAAERLSANPALVSYDGAVGRRQLEWLRGRLKAAASAKQRVIVFCHEPALADAAAADTALWNAEELTRIMEESGVVSAYFAGHHHVGGYALRGGIHHVTIQGLVESPRNGAAYAEVDVYANRLEIRGIGDVPSRSLKLHGSGLPCELWICPDYRYNANELFGSDAAWPTAQKATQVYTLYIRELDDNDPERTWRLEVPRMVGFLRERGMALAIEAAGLYGEQVPDTGARSAATELGMINRIYAAGGKVDYLLLDGPISRVLKGARAPGDGGASANPGYTLRQSVGHLMVYLKTIYAAHPEIKIGLGVNYDWWDFEGYRAFWGTKSYTAGSGYKYNQILDAVLAACATNNVAIHFVHADNPYDLFIKKISDFGGAPLDQSGKMRALQAYCAQHGLDFGVMYNTQNSPDQPFYRDTLELLSLHRNAGILADQPTIQSWYNKVPANYLPDTGQNTFMRLVADFARDLRRYYGMRSR